MEVRIREHTIVTAPFNPPLPFETAYLLFALFDYNTPKADMAHNTFAIVHWDNFGFDGPAPTVNTFNYPTRSFRGYSEVDRGSGLPVTADINIPDDFGDATEVRLLFIQCAGVPCTTMYRSFFSLANPSYAGMPYWSDTDHVLINGNFYPVPLPPTTPYAGPGTLPEDQILGENHAFTSIIQVQKAHLVRGVNNLSFYTTVASVGFPHIEIDVPKSLGFSYTEPPTDMGMFANGFPVDIYTNPWSAGAYLDISRVGDKNPFSYFSEHDPVAFYLPPAPYDNPPRPVETWNAFPHVGAADTPITFSCTGSRGAFQYGANRGVAYAELFINKESVAVMNLHNVPSVKDVSFTFDSRSLENGQNYSFWIMCWGPEGASSAGDYGAWHMNDTWNWYCPVTLNIQSGGSQGVLLNAQPQDPKATFITAPAPPPQLYSKGLLLHQFY